LNLCCTLSLDLELKSETDEMQIKTYIDRPTMSRAAARHAVRVMQEVIAARGQAPVRRCPRRGGRGARP
jgi:hypothetical protein